MTRLLVYMILDVGLALIVATGFAVGALLLWPRWTLSSLSAICMTLGGIVTLSFVVACAAYAAHALDPGRFRRSKHVRQLRIVVPVLVLVTTFLYIAAAIALPAPDPTSRPLFLFGPTDEVQTILWTVFTVFVYLPTTLALLFWHVFTIYFLRSFQKRLPMAGQGNDVAPQRNVADG